MINHNKNSNRIHPNGSHLTNKQERIDLIEDHHSRTHIKLPNVKVHAAFHAIVENQIAMDLESVSQAMARLQRKGLSRHDALYAIGSVAAENVFEAMKSKASDGAREYIDALGERMRETTRSQYEEISAQGGMMVFVLESKRRVLQPHIFTLGTAE